MRTIVVLGASGMLGHQVIRWTSERCNTVAVLRSSSPPEGFPRNLPAELILGFAATNLEAMRSLLERSRPTDVVNCIGVIKQRLGNSDVAEAIRVNALFPHQLAQLCQSVEARLIHISTDCVFAGTRGSYTESDPTDAIDVYGRTKALGEPIGSQALTLRLSMIGPELRYHVSLLDWFVAQQHGAVRGYTQAFFSGLSTPLLAREIRRLVCELPDLNGLWHVTAARISKYELLCKIRDAFGLDVRVTPDDVYQCDRSLIGDAYAGRTGFVPPSWGEMLDELANLQTYSD